MLDIRLIIGKNIGDKPGLNTGQIMTAVSDCLGVDGMTVIDAVGVWRGMAEDSAIVEVDQYDGTPDILATAVAVLAARLHQEAIIVQALPSRTEFINRFSGDVQKAG